MKHGKVVKVRAAKGQGVRAEVASAQWPESQERQAPDSFVLRTYIVDRTGRGKKLHID